MILGKEVNKGLVSRWHYKEINIILESVLQFYKDFSKLNDVIR